MSTKTRAIIGATLLAALAACGGNPESATPTASQDYAIAILGAHADGSGVGLAYQVDLAGMLPNRTYVAEDGRRIVLTSAVIIGTIDRVEPGFGFHAEGDQAGGERVDFDDPDTLWKTVHASVAVEQVLGAAADVQVDSRVTVGFAVGANVEFDRLAAGLEALPRSVFFLDHSLVFAYDPGVYSVPLDGGLVAAIEEGPLELPLVTDPGLRSSLLAGPDRLDELQAAAHEPAVTVPVVLENGLLTVP